MIYITNTISDILTFLAASLFIGSFEEHSRTKTNTIFAITWSCIMSVIMTLCSFHVKGVCYWIALVLYPSRYICLLLVMNKRICRRHLYIIVLYELLVNISVSSLAYLFENGSKDHFRFVSTIISILLNIIMITIFITARSKINYAFRHINNMIPNHIYVLVLCAVISLCALSTLNNYSTKITNVKENIMNLIIVIFTFIMGYIIISLLVNVMSKQHYSNTTAMLQNQVEIQIRHYDKLDKLNKEMNSFKHDYTNHLHSIHSLIEMNESDDALDYIEKLFEAKHKTYSTIFNTGNKLADAILTDKADVLPANTAINYNGIIPSSIDNIDLCTILSNALDNAIEACRETTDSGSITITAQEKQGYFVLTITNPTEHIDFEELPTTTKSNKEHHGMGLLNIQDTVRKYDGQMRVQCEENIFELSVTLKI